MEHCVLILTKLAFISAILTVALEQIFDTDIFDSFNKNVSKTRDFRPWISSFIGILIAYTFDIRALHLGLGLEINDTNLHLSELFRRFIDNFFTGIVIGGGTKTIKKTFKYLVPDSKKKQESDILNDKQKDDNTKKALNDSFNCKITIDFTIDMVEDIDALASKLSITRQAVILMVMKDFLIRNSIVYFANVKKYSQ